MATVWNWLRVSVSVGLMVASANAQSATEEAAPQVDKAAEVVDQQAGKDAKASESTVTQDRWYTMELMGSKAGYTNVKVTEKGDLITTVSRVKLAIGRADSPIEVRIDTQFVETKEGKPVSMKKRESMGQTPVETTYKFLEGGKIEVATKQAGKVKKETVAAPKEEWMTPAAADRYSRERMKAGDKEITISMMDPQMGLSVVKAVRSGFTPEQIDLDDEKVDAIKTTVSVQMGQMPIDSTEFVDAEGDLLQSITNMGGMRIIMKKTTRAQATATNSDNKMPEIMVATFVKPDKAIKGARSLEEGHYLLKVRSGELPDLPTTGSQTVTRVDKTIAKVEVSATRFNQAPAKDADDASYLVATTLADSDDSRIKAFVTQSLKGMDKASVGDKARKLLGAVHEHINEKNLGVGMATATEVVRTREGDCSEHGVLLTAALRAAKIPSRVAVGLIYADQFAGGHDIFGYHMWAQALLPQDDGTLAWTDLDATLRGGREYDATHITLATSALGDNDAMASLMATAQVMGNLDITIESTSSDDGKKEGK